MATTTNFGWETPDDTDLVKDGALAIRTLGSAIDTSLVDLKGGTTGQVLSKTSNTDMDFTWVTSDDANAIQNAIVDAKGDLITATAADTPARLGVGTNGQVLTADSTTATGLKWATAASGGWTLDSTTTLSGSSTSITLPSGYQMIVVIGNNLNQNSTGYPNITLNNDTGANYRNTGIAINGTTPNTSYYQTDGTSLFLSCGGNAKAGANGNHFLLEIFGQDSTTAHKQIRLTESMLSDADVKRASWATGYYRSNTAVTSVQVKTSASWSGGTVLVYGVK